jgi:hypothetical protein
VTPELRALSRSRSKQLKRLKQLKQLKRLRRLRRLQRLVVPGFVLGAVVFGCSSDNPPARGGAATSAGAPASGAGGFASTTGGNVLASSGGASMAGGRTSAGGSQTSGGGSQTSGGGSQTSGGGSQTSGGGQAQAEAGAGGEAGDSAAPGVPGIIAVGYGGLRVVSRDLGKTWENETHWSTNGGDDQDLLRTIAYGNGVWVSAGWRLVTSLDGVSWSDHGKTRDVIAAIGCGLTDGMAFGSGQFLAACGANLASSTDGLSWTKVGPTPDVGGHPYLIWDAAGAQFVCSGDDGPSFVSPDGKAWSALAIDHAHLCAGGLAPKSNCASFYTQGVMLTTEWGGSIRRSTDGTTFEKTYQDQFQNNLFTEYAFGVGRVAP